MGHTTTAARDDFYCPVCNTKNYDKWMEKVERETKKKREEDEVKGAEEERRRGEEERDRVRASREVEGGEGRVEYSNGDVYEGGLVEGVRHGRGRMDYGDYGDVLWYDGEWRNGLHEGAGRKEWVDSLWYEGEWKGGMMHGRGVCHVNEVDVMDGEFEKDEFCGSC